MLNPYTKVDAQKAPKAHALIAERIKESNSPNGGQAFAVFKGLAYIQDLDGSIWACCVALRDIFENNWTDEDFGL